MAHSSHVRSNVLIDLFNLPSLPDKRRTMTITNDFPHDLYLPDRKNSKISQIINKWIFGRQTPDGNEGVGVEILYLEHVYSTRHYIVIKSLAILVQSMITTSNWQISLVILAHLILRN